MPLAEELDDVDDGKGASEGVNLTRWAFHMNRKERGWVALALFSGLLAGISWPANSFILSKVLSIVITQKVQVQTIRRRDGRIAALYVYPSIRSLHLL